MENNVVKIKTRRVSRICFSEFLNCAFQSSGIQSSIRNNSIRHSRRISNMSFDRIVYWIRQVINLQKKFTTAFYRNFRYLLVYLIAKNMKILFPKHTTTLCYYSYFCQLKIIILFQTRHI